MVSTLPYLTLSYLTLLNRTARTAPHRPHRTVPLTRLPTQGIYPTLVIVLVSLQRTTWDSPGASRQRRTHTHTHTGMQFAAAPTPAGAVDTSTDTILSRSGGGGAGRRDAVHPVSGLFKVQATGDRESDEICGDAAEEEGEKKASTMV